MNPLNVWTSLNIIKQTTSTTHVSHSHNNSILNTNIPAWILIPVELIVCEPSVDLQVLRDYAVANL